MGVNQVLYGSRMLIDLTGDTVTADKLLTGYTAHDRAGDMITGTYVPPVFPFAFILVEYPGGSACSCAGASGFKDLSATKKLFYVKSSGNYIIVATDGVKTSSITVNVSYEGQSVSAEIEFGFYLIKAGIEKVAWTNVGYRYSSAAGQYPYELTKVQNTGYINYKQDQIYSQYTRQYTGLIYCDVVSGYSTLNVKMRRNITHSDGCIDFGIIDLNKTQYINSSNVISYGWMSGIIQDDEAVTFQLDVSSYSASDPKIYLAVRSGTTRARLTDVDVYDIWLS